MGNFTESANILTIFRTRWENSPNFNIYEDCYETNHNFKKCDKKIFFKHIYKIQCVSPWSFPNARKILDILNILCMLNKAEYQEKSMKHLFKIREISKTK